MARYRVSHHTEEFGCPTCGAPVYVGDTAYQDGPDGACYCSVYCAGADHAACLRKTLARDKGREPSPGFWATQSNAASGQ